MDQTLNVGRESCCEAGLMTTLTTSSHLVHLLVKSLLTVMKLKDYCTLKKGVAETSGPFFPLCKILTLKN